MENDQNAIMHSRQQVTDEIDLIDLFIKIWRWKWFITALVIVITSSAFFVIYSTPDTYTVRASLRIGTVGSLQVQEPESVTSSLASELSAITRQQNYMIINDQIQNSTQNNDILSKYSATVADTKNKFLFTLNFETKKNISEYSVKSHSAQVSGTWAKIIGDSIINKHRPLYPELVRQVQTELLELKRMNVHVDDKFIRMKLMFENQKYPTDYITEPIASTRPDPDKKIALKTAVAFFASLFFGIFLSFLVDYMLTIKKEIKLRSGK